MISRGFSSFEDNTSSQTIIQYENIMFPSKGYKWNIAYNPQGVNIIGNEKSVPQSHTYLLVNEPFYNLNFQQGFTIFLSQDNTNYLLDFRDIMNLNCPAGQHIQLDFTCSISNCPSFSSLDTTKNKCYCDPNAFYSPTANSCTCSYGFTSSGDSKSCICQNGYYDIYECEKTYCKQYSIVGFTGYKSNQNANLRYFLKMNITQQNEISINYSTWSNSVLYGVQSQFLLFQMVVCLNGLANFRDQCQECPSGFFQQQDIIRNINICVKCDSSCLTCKQSSTKCTSCSQENPYFLKDQNKCQQQYPNQYYCEKDLNSSIQYNCTLCINCLQCRSQVECCDNNLFKFNFQNQNCECFDQQTMVYHTNHQKCSCKDENTMVNNIKNCTCKDTSNMKYNPIQQKCECLDLETMVFDNYKCICKDEQMTFQISQNKCVCNENMQFNSTTFKCDCIDVNNMIYNPQNKMCECPPNNSCQFCNTQDGYFISGTRCIACALGCKTCKGSLATDCLTCVEYKYLFTDYTCRQCITGDGYFTKNIYCLPCDQTCQTCFGENKNQCQSCFEDSQLINSVCEQQYYTYKSKYFTNEKYYDSKHTIEFDIIFQLQFSCQRFQFLKSQLSYSNKYKIT
ncbi:hypothetical protein ABPG74_015055 [Tetrahymena malaccensis]